MKKSKILDSIISIFLNKKYQLTGNFHITGRSGINHGEKDWSISHAGLDRLPYKGEGERVGILDTGVDINHKDLKGRIELLDFLHSKQVDGDYEHGTFVAGEILAHGDKDGVIGVAPLAEGFCCKVLYGDSRDASINFEKTLHNAIQASWRNGCGVISMSIGFGYKSRLIEEALIEAVNNGVIPIAASGNDGMKGSLYRSYPASYNCCISVGGANKKNMPAWFSSTGTENSLLAEEQPEIAVAGREYYWGCLPDSKYGKMAGTSMACPIIAGTALLWREAMKKRGQLPVGSDVLKSFREWLKTVSFDSNLNGWDYALGWGVLSVKDGDL